ncbi:hypothetical protein SR870_02015 [Rhodopseudomonas palustris]|uniref:hypothetical protein n=1 Tax=Rhodopseudomonas palustris TaxID=1076 RepID=UPI002ACE099D|nr:hypothetical protein [Rhodopseudomonas palustris]WQH00093.1 hypothetical protein SR870_02015 [Rhodopseudomonas palustris]
MTPKQTLIMWCLLGRKGQAMQGEIVPKVEKKDREALVADGLISSAKIGRAIGIELEDKGWNWAGQHLGDELPKNYQVLQQWLAMLQRHLERSGETLADFIGPAPEWPPASTAKEPKPKPRKAPAGPKKKGKKVEPDDRNPESTPPSPEQLRARIEQAYLAITNGRKGEPVALSKLRAQLSDLDRATVDGGLRRIHKNEIKAGFGRNDDPKDISAEESEAAFSTGGDPYHFIWFQS